MPGKTGLETDQDRGKEALKMIAAALPSGAFVDLAVRAVEKAQRGALRAASERCCKHFKIMEREAVAQTSKLGQILVELVSRR